MSYLRIIFRCSAVFVWSCITLIVVGSALFFCSDPWKRRQQASCWTRWWAKRVAVITGIRLKVHGEITEHCGTLVVANHLGYLDIPALASIFKLRFTPKAEIRKWPFFGWLTGLNQPLWINRKARIQAKNYAIKFRETLAHDISLIVFPEGTSTSGKNGLLPFKSTCFDCALNGEVIQPVLIFYHDMAAWHDDTPFLFHLLRVLSLKAVDIDVYIMETQSVMPGEERKQLAKRIHDLMENKYWSIAENEQKF